MITLPKGGCYQNKAKINTAGAKKKKYNSSVTKTGSLNSKYSVELTLVPQSALSRGFSILAGNHHSNWTLILTN